MKQLKLWSLALLSAGVMTFSSCSDDDGPSAVEIETITATGTDVISGEETTVDLNGATSASDVPPNAIITVTFSREVDAATVSASSISISDGSTETSTTLATNGAVVTISLSGELERGTDYTLAIDGSVKATDGGTFTSTSRSFKTGGRKETAPPQSSDQVSYWKLDGDDTDAVGSSDADNRINITYVNDRFGQAEGAALFDGTSSLIEIPGGSSLITTDDFTLSFWIKSDGSKVNDLGETQSQFVLGLAAWYGMQFEIGGNYSNCKLAAVYSLSGGSTQGQDLWWSTNGDLGWQGWTFDQDVSGSGGLAAIIKDQWAHIVVTYDAASKVGSMYINGTLRKSQDFNLYGEDHPLFNATGLTYTGNDAPGDKLALGFIQGSENRIVLDEWANPINTPDNSHFKGEMDDVRIFHASFSADDVTTLYNAEKP